MTAVALVLIGWSVSAAVWWLVARWLLAAANRKAGGVGVAAPSLGLSIFKAIPRGLGEAAYAQLEAAMESFVAQMDERSEILVGVPQERAGPWQRVIERWSRTYPKARIKTVCRRAPEQRANPKIGWMEILAAEADADYWLWSDADIIAPDGLLNSIRQGLAEGCGVVTCAYRVRNVSTAVGALDALFVDAEFLPGVLLLGRRGISASAFGAAVAFPAKRFKERVSWDELGGCLADDFLIGQRMGPVRLCPVIVETIALQTRIVPALRHYYRWHKTLRWCRPPSYASMLSILPLLGWLAAISFFSSWWVLWAGFVGQWLFEVMVAMALLSAIGCRYPRAAWWVLGLWPVVRCLTWVATWFPISVVWEGARGRWSNAGISRPGGG